MPTKSCQKSIEEFTPKGSPAAVPSGAVKLFFNQTHFYFFRIGKNILKFVDISTRSVEVSIFLGGEVSERNDAAEPRGGHLTYFLKSL